MTFETEAQRAASQGTAGESEVEKRLRTLLEMAAHMHEMLHAIADVELANSKKLDVLLASAVNSDKLAELAAELKGPTDALNAAIAANKPK